MSASDSDGASVGAPTRDRHVNGRSAPAFDMNAFAQVLSQYTSQHVPAVNVSGGKAAPIAKSGKPKWDVKTEPFNTFKLRVMIWAESHCIEHLLNRPRAGDMRDFECHNVARRTILLALSATDTNYTADTTYLCEAWQLLLERHEPSRDIEVSDLYEKLSVATQRGRSMGDHVNECMTYRNRLKALGADIPRDFFNQKLLDVDKEYMFMRASLRIQSPEQTPEQIVATLMEQYQLFLRHMEMNAVVVKRLHVRIAQGSTGLAAKDDHRRLQSQQSVQAGVNIAPAITAARRGTYGTSARIYTRRSRSS